MSDDAVLELRSVTAGYGRTTVLHEVSVEVREHSVTALLGPNGSGKTTTLRVASGLLGTNGGEVWLHGRDVTRSLPHVRARLGLCMIPEGRGVFPNLSVRENLRLQTHRSERSEDLTEKALDLFPALSAHLRQKAGTLSGGQQQMVALARTSISGATVILLDEVSMGLSPTLVDQIFDALRRIAARGTAILLVEQYISRALDIADEVVMLKKGGVSLRSAASELDGDKVSEHYFASTSSDTGVSPASSGLNSR